MIPDKIPCRGCKKPILWGLMTVLEGGVEVTKKIPLDPVPAVYNYLPPVPGDAALRVERNREAAVSHYATCARASEFHEGGSPEAWKPAVVWCWVDVIDGPFKGLHGQVVQESFMGPGNEKPFAGWWIRVVDDLDRPIGVCHVSKDQVKART